MRNVINRIALLIGCVTAAAATAMRGNADVGGPCMIASLMVVLMLAGCAGTQGVAPVSNVEVPPQATPRPAVRHHTVLAGETLSLIAQRYGYSYRELARWNDIAPPYLIYAGQRLIISPAALDAGRRSLSDNTRGDTGARAAATTGSNNSGLASKDKPTFKASREEVEESPNTGFVTVSPDTQAGVAGPKPAVELPPTNAESLSSDLPSEPASGATESKLATTPPLASLESLGRRAGNSGITWKWPAAGTLLENFSASSKGLSIGGEEGQPIRAAAAGRVVYSGAGLIGRGEVVIIKHDKTWLSAYAHNKKRLVKEGDAVTAGQTVAEMGRTGTDQMMLYFEIRKDGKPVDPLQYLPNLPR